MTKIRNQYIIHEVEDDKGTQLQVLVQLLMQLETIFQKKKHILLQFIKRKIIRFIQSKHFLLLAFSLSCFFPFTRIVEGPTQLFAIKQSMNTNTSILKIGVLPPLYRRTNPASVGITLPNYYFCLLAYKENKIRSNRI